MSRFQSPKKDNIHLRKVSLKSNQYQKYIDSYQHQIKTIKKKIVTSKKTIKNSP